jgi:uncharacterized membrane protein
MTPTPEVKPERSSVALRWTSVALVAITWVSAAIFGAYILAFYGGAISDQRLERWNEALPGLYDANVRGATIGIALHFLAGGTLLLLGPVQLIGSIRERWRGLHRWTGRVFVTAALATAIGGLTFVGISGTIGGGPMDVGFALYGALMLLAGIQTIRHARARRFDVHRAWGIRLFALVVGSWLYRIEYGFWFMLADGAGHTNLFDGPFDVFMDFAFYLPNLAVAELFVRAKARPRTKSLEIVATVVLALATLFLVVGTYFFTRHYWGPEIVARF